MIETYLEDGQFLLERGEYAAAIALFETALAEYPDAARLHVWYAIALDASGNTEAALTALQPWLKDPEVGADAQKLRSIWKAPRLNQPEDRFQFDVVDADQPVVIKAAASPSSPRKSDVPDAAAAKFPWQLWFVLLVGAGLGFYWLR